MNTSNTKFTTSFWIYTNPSSVWVFYLGRDSWIIPTGIPWRLGSRNTSTLSQPSTAPVTSLESDHFLVQKKSIWVDWLPRCQVPALLTQCLKRARTWSLEESDGWTVRWCVARARLPLFAGAQPSRDDPVLRGRIRLCSLTWNPAFEFWWIPFNALVLCWGLLNYWFLALATRLFILRWYIHINGNHLHVPCIMFIHFICNYPHTHTCVCVCVYV